MSDDYPRTGKTLYLNIIWHQHQPSYLDPGTDQLQGPWVRTHGTKDYYDMVSILKRYPDIRFTVNLTSSLLFQLEEYYVKRLARFVDVKKNRVNADRYFEMNGGTTDPWIDLALKPTGRFVEKDLRFLLTNVWNAFGISTVMFERFPEYKRLKEKSAAQKGKGLTEQELREVKFWFYLANFDPDFLKGEVELENGFTVDLTDLIAVEGDGTFRLKKVVTEDDCNRMVAETYKVLSAIIPLHKKLMLSPDFSEGQIEVITTPFYHPILPLIYDSDLAKLCQPNDVMPARFHFPKDADAQVAKAVQYYEQKFGRPPTGMWPAEGAVAHDVVTVFGRHGIRWIATDEKILFRSKPSNHPKYYPCVLSADPEEGNPVVVVFRDTELSDKIGFVYQNYRGEEAADDFIRGILRYVPHEDEPDRLLTVILDGENAWEWYRFDPDGKEFQNALYRKLTRLYETRQVVTTTVSEYIQGNPRRGIPAHPVISLPRLDWLWPGSWINANYDTWIGEEEENRAWEYLLVARTDLEHSGLKQPDPRAKPPRKGSKSWNAYMAWESMYAAEGSDWFWWYGTDQSAPAGERPFDQGFVTHLRNVYEFARQAGGRMRKREFKPIMRVGREGELPAGVAMMQSREDMVTVSFQVDANAMYVRRAIFIVGSRPELGDWVPNMVRMYDDGTHGDEKPNDGIWTLDLQLPAGAEIEYKYTNSGAVGSWHPGEEFPGLNRKVRIEASPGQRVVLRDRFGVI